MGGPALVLAVLLQVGNGERIIHWRTERSDIHALALLRPLRGGAAVGRY